MLIALLVALAPASSPPLRVELSSPKTRVGIFEPVKLTIRATAEHSVRIPGAISTTGYPLVETWIDSGRGYALYSDDDGDMHEGIEGERRELAIGDRFIKTVVLVNGPMNVENVPFPKPGRYSLRVVLRLPEKVVLGESEPIVFDVSEPGPEDKPLVDRIKDKPWVLRGNPDDPDYASLVRDFPHSSYLQWGKRGAAVERAQRISSGRYPDTAEKYAVMAQGSSQAPSLYRHLATELVEDDRWGQFDEERLQLAADAMERSGGYEEAKKIWAQILKRFPDSEAAEHARGRLDSKPPTLRVDASPSSLWPPDGRMEPITVSVQVSDDQDANPRVSLVSITCEGKCDPGRDVSGAALGTDDRTFSLRSTSSGAVRTYKIVYLARDAAGNRTTAETTVRVTQNH
jgi:hypothetical protein